MEFTISVRAITSNDGMTADIFYFKEFLKRLSGRIIGEEFNLYICKKSKHQICLNIKYLL